MKAYLQISQEDIFNYKVVWRIYCRNGRCGTNNGCNIQELHYLCQITVYITPVHVNIYSITTSYPLSIAPNYVDQIIGIGILTLHTQIVQHLSFVISRTCLMAKSYKLR